MGLREGGGTDRVGSSCNRLSADVILHAAFVSIRSAILDIIAFSGTECIPATSVSLDRIFDRQPWPTLPAKKRGTLPRARLGPPYLANTTVQAAAAKRCKLIRDGHFKLSPGDVPLYNFSIRFFGSPHLSDSRAENWLSTPQQHRVPTLERIPHQSPHTKVE